MSRYSLYPPGTIPYMRRKIRAYLVLPHLWAVVIVVAATGAFGLLAADGHPPAGRFALLLLGMLGGQLAIGALNEWCDREMDAAAKPWKPIPAGDVSPRSALGITAGGLLLMVVAAGLLGGWELLVLAIAIGSGLVYDLGVKRTPFSGLPYLVALPLVPIWAWLVMDRFQPRLLWLYPIGALLIVAIHLAQVIPDIQGDRRLGERGLAVVLGERWASILLWVAAFASTIVVAIGAVWLGNRPLAGVAAACVIAAVLLLALLLYRRNPARTQPYLFQVLTASAVVLGCGWAIAVVS
jgi:4-hydroxybenzoate polyprenyltransferase